ncbi:F-box protein At5g07610-like [Chenopodium quinoa]|uniref:F-box protein At3g26010-like beta-propeller domain-containing protein n=1 Tax=Chenopodium quinoa TaxID=63459 RepID=A0A803LWV8_CHEQI|nr:F-box protein At5g07610-like [Chenopodium quinoa]
MEEPIADPEFGPTSAEKVAGNEDLATEIFIHLPATSLAPCLRVSKWWLSFISNQSFVSRHNLLYPPSLSGLFLIPRQTAQHPEVRFLSLNKSKFFTLPFAAFLNAKEKDYTLHLAFDPLISPNYKVVCLKKVGSQPSHYRIAIYSSKTRLWSLSQEPVCAPNELDFKDGVFCNGAIHWLTSKCSGAYIDLKTEILREMPLPPRREEESEYKFKYFGKSQGYLFYVISRPLFNHYELYQTKEDYSGWELKFRVNLNVLIAKFPVMARNFGRHPSLFSELECDVLCIYHARANEGMEIVLSVPGEVIFFNLEKKNVSVVQDKVFRPSDVTIWYKTYLVYEYFETLSVV